MLLFVAMTVLVSVGSVVVEEMTIFDVTDVAGTVILFT